MIGTEIHTLLYIKLIIRTYCIAQAFLVAQTLQNSPAMQETQLQSIGQEDPLEKGLATQPSISVWRTS